MARLVIYGATGYSGRKCAQEAAARGLDFVVAGRNPDKVSALANALGVKGATVDVNDAQGINRLFEGAACVLNAAGPFAATAPQLIDACLAQGPSYIDITGEYKIFRLAQSLSNKAQSAGVMLMPGVGWDIVPSDCLVAHVGQRVQDPQCLRLALAMPGSAPSRGTLRTILEQGLATTFIVRRDGELVELNRAPPPRKMRFSFGEQNCAPLTTGDLIGSHLTTGVRNIDVFVAADSEEDFVMPDGGIEQFPEGPTEEQLNAWRSYVLVELTGADGKVSRSEIQTSAGYKYTGEAAIEIAARILRGHFEPGFQSPASAYGADLATDIGGSITDHPDEIHND